MTKRRKITWFNPPLSNNVSPNVVLIDRHFPMTNKLSKIMNKNTVKQSARSTVASQTSGSDINHNKGQSTSEKTCNWRNREKGRLD